MLGFLQFISPTVGFLIGVETGEGLTPLRLLSFGFIWVGAALFIVGAWRAARPAPAEPAPDPAAERLPNKRAQSAS
jgi:chloramphenicol-sensitive protein RarD